MSKSPQAQGGSRKRPRLTAEEVLRTLAAEHGPAEWEPRYDPASELVYTILSQHTSDINSERAFNRLLETFGSLESVAEAEVGEIESAVRVGGLSRVKAPRIKRILQQVQREVGSLDLSFLGEMPLDDAKAWLKRLDGVGPKTAAVILCFSLGMPAMPVDTHIFRVSKRLGLIGKKTTAEQAHDLLEGMVAPDAVFAFHIYLIRHGRQVCKAQRPRCSECVLAHGCPSRRQFERAEARRRKAVSS